MSKNYKLAILHVPHEQCEKSIEEMLTSAGYSVFGIGRDVSHLLNTHMKPVVASRLIKKAELHHFEQCNLFVTVKHYNLPSIAERYTHLNGKVLWFDINGGNPGQFISQEPRKTYPLQVPVPYLSANKRYAEGSPHEVSGPRYVCYIPLTKRYEFLEAAHRRRPTQSPVCLVHNVKHWGYGWLVSPLMRFHGVRFYGGFGSPTGLIDTTRVPEVLETALCLVHAKSHDCPGCALYESLLTGCPVIITDLFLKQTLYNDLYEDDVTCLVVKDDATLSFPDRTNYLMDQLTESIERLKDPKENARIGAAGRRRIVQLMWQSEREQDVASFTKFMEDNFQ
jgi:hypothetical protein